MIVDNSKNLKKLNVKDKKLMKMTEKIFSLPNLPLTELNQERSYFRGEKFMKVILPSFKLTLLSLNLSENPSWWNTKKWKKYQYDEYDDYD